MAGVLGKQMQCKQPKSVHAVIYNGTTVDGGHNSSKRSRPSTTGCSTNVISVTTSGCAMKATSVMADDRLLHIIFLRVNLARPQLLSLHPCTTDPSLLQIVAWLAKQRIVVVVVVIVVVVVVVVAVVVVVVVVLVVVQVVILVVVLVVGSGTSYCCHFGAMIEMIEFDRHHLFQFSPFMMSPVQVRHGNPCGVGSLGKNIQDGNSRSSCSK